MDEQNYDFDDVLNELMLAESEPDYQTLLRWSDRYPQYREDLADFFATWAVQKTLAEVLPPPEIDEERLVKKGVEYGLEILRRQGRIIPEGQIEPLTPFEQLVLTAVYDFHGDGYSVNIAARVSEMSGQRVSLDSTIETLDSLEKRHVLDFWEPDPEYHPEEADRRYFTITMYGERSLAKAKESSQNTK